VGEKDAKIAELLAKVDALAKENGGMKSRIH